MDAMFHGFTSRTSSLLILGCPVLRIPGPLGLEFSFAGFHHQWITSTHLMLTCAVGQSCVLACGFRTLPNQE